MDFLGGAWTGQGTKAFLGRAADWTPPFLGQFGEAGSRGYFPFPVTSVGVVDIPAIRGLALIHLFRFRHGGSS